MKLDKKEKRILIAAGACVLFLLYSVFILSPAFSKIGEMEKLLAKNESLLSEMKKLKAVHDAYSESMKKAEALLIQRGENFAILSYLESESRKLNIDKRINYMKPVNFPELSGNLQLAGIEMNLVDINTKEMVEFLHKIESCGKLLSISRIKIQRPAKEGPQLLNVTLQINTYHYTGKFPPRPVPATPAGSMSPPDAGRSGHLSPALAEALKKPSHEFNDAEFVSFIHLSILGKEVSEKHRSYWVKKLRRGMSRAEVIRHFFASDEYQLKNKSHADFITDLYITILNREPNISDIHSWTARLEQGEKRDDIMEAFFQSSEYQNKKKKDSSWFVEWLRFLR